MTEDKRLTLKDLLESWSQEQDKTLLFEVGMAMVPLMQMLGTTEGTPQNIFNVNIFTEEDNACILTMYWGKFVVLRLPDKEELKGLWGMLVPVECDKHGTEWTPFPMASTLPHMLRTGLTMCINHYMATQLGEVTVPQGTIIN